ncbi:MAG: lipopolysaccharide kinase InaA family protein [Paramuribaculum sp.]|nr:lipopolysaccharide kinase InaA family protein [Paramuribaculum sp.]
MRTKVLTAKNCPAVLADAGSVAELCANPQAHSEVTMIHNGRNRVVLFSDAKSGHQYVIKCFKKPNMAQRVAYTWFTPSKAKRAYRYAAKLRERGIDTPREVACIEVYERGMLSRGYFICEYCPWPSLASLWLPAQPFTQAQIELLAQTLVDMHLAGVLHGDTNIGNFLYDAEHNAMTTVDVNRTRFHDRVLSQRECLDNMVRLTHRTDVLKKVGELYAAKRGWNKDECVKYLLDNLLRFEQKRNRRNKLKHILFLR